MLLVALLATPPAATAEGAVLSSLQLEWPAGCVPASGPAQPKETALLRDFYAQRQYLAAWDAPGRLDSLVLQLEQLSDDGLEPADYQLNAIRQFAAQATAGTPLPLCAELLASLGYLQALQDLAHGRLPQQQLEPLWHASQSQAASAAATLLVAQNGLADLPATFAAARPREPRYLALRQAYAQLHQQPLADWPRIDAGPLLRLGARDRRMPQLVQRLAAEGYLPPPDAAALADLQFSPPRVAALQAFQQRHGLQPDGLLGPASLAELNVSPRTRRDQLRINLERWRWLARLMEPSMLLVDLTGGQLTAYREGQSVWQTRVIVGRPMRPTPLLKSALNRLTLHPSWTVPPTILRQDKLPEIRRDPGFLAEHQLQVYDRDGNPLDPQQVNWHNPGPILLRQPPGPLNPLGQLALRFPNPFSVYLHDTPNPELFAKAPRIFSSGCVRVEQVQDLLPLLLDPAEERLVRERLASGQSSEYRLSRPLPILFGYWTAEADTSGRPLYRPDIYGHDARLLAALERASH